MANGSTKSKKEFITIKELSRRLKVSYPAAWKAVKRGRVNSKRDGKKIQIEWPRARDEFKQKRDLSKVRKKDAKRIGVDAPSLNGHGKASGNGKPDLYEERAKKEKYLAAIRELEFNERSGALVSADAVRDAAFKRGREIRDAFQNLPDRIAALVAAENDEARCHEIIAKEVETILRSLVDREPTKLQ